MAAATGGDPAVAAIRLRSSREQRPAKALLPPCPILPSFSVLARACLWCLGARVWRVNLPSCVKSISNSCLTPRIVLLSCRRPSKLVGVPQLAHWVGGREHPGAVRCRGRCPGVRSVLGYWVKPCGTRLGLRKGGKGAVRLPKILVLVLTDLPWRQAISLGGEAHAASSQTAVGRVPPLRLLLALPRFCSACSSLPSPLVALKPGVNLTA